ncbi:hypothetical protein DSO57_1002016 [Entomophthora muscae]|uniref:Uncharacterized protein n=1 Tax=Entomophthora muscae TaxID=34485 RepID=A0ACC2RNX4_9FUNG|nr:hypothetical protein DSO57_1002016 [Entomophthora muscae]
MKPLIAALIFPEANTSMPVLITEAKHTENVNSLPPLALDRSIFPCCTKKAHTVDERFVLAYPAKPLPLITPSWEETLVNLDYLLAWYCPLLKTIRAGQSEAITLSLSNTSEFQMTSASSSQSDLTAEIGMKPSCPPAPA